MVVRGAPAPGDESGLSPTANDRPVVAVVIPVHRHSVLVVEAVQSVLRQKARFPIAAIIVDDGCPFAETMLVGISYATGSRNVRYLQQMNGGLSSARNRGIDHVLAEMPTVQAVFFLDADNRISPTTIDTSFALLRPDQGIGWVYPNIDRFGIAWSGNYTGPYSRLLHVTFDNICEAGSLVAREVLKAGVRFDETMKLGGEDWDFWLQCLEKGYTGINNPIAGFEYRHRPESMISTTKRQIAQVREQLRARHPLLNSFAALLAFEHREAPRFLCIDPLTGDASAFSDPAHEPHAMSTADVIRAVQAEAHEPETHGLPGLLLWMSPATLQLLADFRIVWSLLNVIEKRQRHHDAIAVVLEHDAGRLGFAFAEADDAPSVPDSVHGIGARLSLLTRDAPERVASRRERARPAGDVGKLLTIRIRGPFGARAVGGMAFRAEAPIRAMSAALAAADPPLAKSPRWSWRTAHFPRVADRAKLIARHLGLIDPIPRIPDSSRVQVAIALPSSGHGDTERISFAVARELRRAGYEPHLFVFGPSSLRIPTGEKLFFSSVNFFAEKTHALRGGEHVHMGHELSLERDRGAMVREVLGFLAGMDVVVNFDVAPLNAAAGALRARGVRFLSHLHALDRTAFGRPVGNRYLALAFEHGQDAILVSSRRLANWLHGMGVPRDKVWVIPNAGTSASPAKPPPGIAAPRRTRSANTPIKAVYLGKLESSHGIERFVAAVQLAKARGSPVSWRVIGVDARQNQRAAPWIQRLSALDLPVEPLAPGVEGQSRILMEADVLVMPSRSETAPLLLVDAQRLGCVPVVTNSGSFAELIDGGTDGILIDDGDDASVAAAVVAQIEWLADDRDRVMQLAEGAMARAARLDWSASCKPLVDLLRAWFPGKPTRSAQ